MLRLLQKAASALRTSAPLPAPPVRPSPRAGWRLDDALSATARALLEPLQPDKSPAAPLWPVEVYWSQRLRTTAGLAYARDNRVVLHSRLRETGGDAELERTLRHELAHLLARQRAGRKPIAPHGPEWLAACADLGIPGESRCHTLALGVRRRQTPRLIYVCPACGDESPRVRPFRHPVACLDCCRQHHGGRYHSRYRLRLRAP